MMLYLASPYYHPKSEIREYRYLGALQASAYLFKQGVVVYSSIVHWHVCSQMYKLPTDAASWERQNFPMIEKCSEVGLLLINGWQDSKGMKDEYEYAMSLGKYINGYELSDRDLVCIGIAPLQWPSSA